MRSSLLATLGVLLAAPCAAQATDRWQMTLSSGVTVWDLHLVRLNGDTLVLQGADSILSVPLPQLDELRLVQKSQRSVTPEPGRYGGVLGGGDDVVYRLTLLDLNERRQTVQQILHDHPPS